MLVVAEEEALPAVALVAAHHVDTALLTAAVALGTLVHICAGQAGGEAAGTAGSQAVLTSHRQAQGSEWGGNMREWLTQGGCASLSLTC